MPPQQPRPGGRQNYPPSGTPAGPSFPATVPSTPSLPPAPPSPPSPPPLPPVGSPSVLPNPITNTVINAVINSTNERVGYFKIDLYNTKANLYGESTEKWYYPPVEVKCILERGDITNTDTEYGVDVNQTLIIKVSIDTFQSVYNFTPEVGDIVSESERYYEINSVNRTVVTQPGGTPGGIVSQTIMYVLSAYLTRTSKLNLVKYST
jgi:hypothetical protein